MWRKKADAPYGGPFYVTGQSQAAHNYLFKCGHDPYQPRNIPKIYGR